jgi:hypothetical protein
MSRILAPTSSIAERLRGVVRGVVRGQDAAIDAIAPYIEMATALAIDEMRDAAAKAVLVAHLHPLVDRVRMYVRWADVSLRQAKVLRETVARLEEIR